MEGDDRGIRLVIKASRAVVKLEKTEGGAYKMKIYLL
jgi:hypothetical protein